MNSKASYVSEGVESAIRISAWNALRECGIGQERCYAIINAVVAEMLPKLATLSPPLPSLEVERARDLIAQIQLIACNQGGWVENDAWEGVCQIHALASAALSALPLDGGL